MFFAGVDAGGTKTAFVLCDESLKVLARHSSGDGRLFSVGQKGLEAAVGAGIGELCRLAGIRRADITWAGAGFPGYGEMEGSEALLEGLVQRAVGSGHVTCQCDCHVGWAASLGLKPGINMVAGTGAICYGVGAGGHTARSSGWGAYCDEGSCTWVGARLIAEVTKQADGRKPRTALYEMFRAGMGIEVDAYFIHTLNRDFAVNRGETAALQVLAEKMARAKDPVAMSIYQEAAQELCMAIFAVAQKLNMENGFTSSYSGGLFKAGDCILGPLAAGLALRGGRLEKPLFPPELGAVLMAMQAYNPALLPRLGL